MKVNGHEIPNKAVEYELNRLIHFYVQHGVPEEQIRKWDRERTRGINPAIALMHEGKTCAEIGQELGISEAAAHYLVVDAWREDKEARR